MSSTAADDNANGNDAGLGVAQHLNWSTIPVERMAEGIERQMLVGVGDERFGRKPDDADRP
jgi:hypothetical protein